VFSYPEEQIIRETKRLIEQGAREIWLTSTDNSAYGRDSRTNIAHLLSKICEIEGEFMVRIGMMNPLLTQKNQEELIHSFSHPKVFKFLHLPVQSGSDRILREMQRGYSTDSYFETVRAFRSKLPRLTLSTDIIVGFPSESESEFEESMELIRLSRPDIVNISRFGAREGTKASIMDNQIDSRSSKDRSTRMTHLVKEISAANNRDWMNWKGQVLLDEVGKGAFIGRNFAYKPCVIVEEEFLSSEPHLGEFATVTVYDFTSSTLRATLATNPSC
jgi:threonylcarbamoyladenosine tRNA methylthiotransferase CDKAL1